MNSQIQDDLKLFKRAKRRINAMLVFSYLLLGLWNAAIYFLLTQPLFERPHSFLILYLTSMLAQMIVSMMIFFALSEGKPKLRILLILGVLAQISWCGFLVYDLVQAKSFILFYVIWIAMELVPVFYLLWLRGWLKNSWWARIFFDHVIELEDDEEEQIFQPIPQQQPLPQNGYVQDGYPQGYGYPNQNGWVNQNGYPNGYPNQQPYGYENPQVYPQAVPNGQQPWPPQGQPLPNQAYQGYPQQPQVNGQNDYIPFQQSSVYQEPYSEPIPTQEVYVQEESISNPAYVTPASSFAGNPDISQENQFEEYEAEEYEEETPKKKFSFFSRKQSQEPKEAQFVNQGPVDFQPDAQFETLRQREAARQSAYELLQSYSHMAIRIAAVVYGELVIFPILINIFQSHFVSIDNSSIFAINLMFTLCILSAVVWTIPIFFLYLKQPGVKKILWGAAALQVCVAAFGLWMLHGYYVSETTHYADKVYTYFLMAEVVRYGLLIAGILPAFQLPSLKDIETNFIEDDLDDSNIVLELVEEEDPESDEEEPIQPQSTPFLSQPSENGEPTLSRTQARAHTLSNDASQETPSTSASFLEIDEVASETPSSTADPTS